MTDNKLNTRPLELWAGLECTVNRVGDRYFDQLERSGHDIRTDDIERLAGLGVRTMRYPILWERTAPWALDKKRLNHWASSFSGPNSKTKLRQLPKWNLESASPARGIRFANSPGRDDEVVEDG